MTTIGSVLSEITCLIKIDTDASQADRRKREITVFAGLVERQENIKLASRPMDSAYARGLKVHTEILLTYEHQNYDTVAKMWPFFIFLLQKLSEGLSSIYWTLLRLASHFLIEFTKNNHLRSIVPKCV